MMPMMGAEAAATHATLEMTPIVHIVDGDGLLRDVLHLIDAFDWRMESFALISQFLSRPPSCGLGCVILDISPSSLGTVAIEMACDQIGLPTIAVGRADVETAVRVLKAGAVDFLPTPVDAQALCGAIGHAIALSRRAVGERMQLVALRSRHAALSQRERQVMELIVTGLLNKQVGGELGISEITVKAHRGQIMRKMKARSFAELVGMALTLRASPLRLAA